MKNKQTPGRIEALNIVLRLGTQHAPAHLLRIAGMGHDKQPRAADPALNGIAFSRGESGLSPAETAALPF
jgi:hypothetical protein